MAHRSEDGQLVYHAFSTKVAQFDAGVHVRITDPENARYSSGDVLLVIEDPQGRSHDGGPYPATGVIDADGDFVLLWRREGEETSDPVTGATIGGIKLDPDTMFIDHDGDVLWKNGLFVVAKETVSSFVPRGVVYNVFHDPESTDVNDTTTTWVLDVDGDLHAARVEDFRLATGEEIHAATEEYGLSGPYHPVGSIVRPSHGYLAFRPLSMLLNGITLQSSFEVVPWGGATGGTKIRTKPGDTHTRAATLKRFVLEQAPVGASNSDRAARDDEFWPVGTLVRVREDWLKSDDPQVSRWLDRIGVVHAVETRKETGAHPPGATYVRGDYAYKRRFELVTEEPAQPVAPKSPAQSAVAPLRQLDTTPLFGDNIHTVLPDDPRPGTEGKRYWKPGCVVEVNLDRVLENDERVTQYEIGKHYRVERGNHWPYIDDCSEPALVELFDLVSPPTEDD